MINVTLHNEQKEVEVKPFPKLMIDKSDGTIIYFRKKGYGLVLKGEAKLIELQEKGWDMDLFTDYNEPLTIQNA